MPGRLHHAACLLADQHIKVKLHVVAQKFPGQADHGPVEWGGLGLHVEVEGGPHHLADVLPLPGRQLHVAAQVVSVRRDIDPASSDVITQTPVGLQLHCTEQVICITESSQLETVNNFTNYKISISIKISCQQLYVLGLHFYNFYCVFGVRCF